MLTALIVLLRSVGLICRGHGAVALEDQFVMSATVNASARTSRKVMSSTRRFCRSTGRESTVARPVLILANHRSQESSIRVVTITGIRACTSWLE